MKKDPGPEPLKSVRSAFAWREFGLVLSSIWIVYHLTCIWLMPNSGSFLGRRWGPVFYQYANTLNFHLPWNFFSPEPASALLFEYSVNFENAEGVMLKEPISKMIPEQNREGIFNPSERRFLYMARYLMTRSEQIEPVLVDWLCRSNPGANSVRIQFHLFVQPSFDLAVLNRDQRVEDLAQQKTFLNQLYNCPERSL